MPTHRSPLIAASLALSIVAAACAGGPDGASLLSPTTPVSSISAVASLTVEVDSICDGQESQIRVFVDAQPIGLTNPGEPGVARMVTIGEHQVSAISQRGTQWGPFPTTVTAAGRTERLGCMPPDQPPNAL